MWRHLNDRSKRKLSKDSHGLHKRTFMLLTKTLNHFKNQKKKLCVQRKPSIKFKKKALKLNARKWKKM